MFQSIYDDIKQYFRSGNMVTRLILINCIVFITLVLLKILTYSFATKSDSSFYISLTQEYLATPGYWKTLVTHPWTLFTSMFVQLRVWHLAWNMLVLHWFGRIVGDLLGDRRILPLYILGGVFGSMVFVVVSSYFYGMNGHHLIGASAGVMAIVVASGVTSPDYLYHLPVIGAVKIKFLILAVIVIDILGTMSGNSGGSFAHLGGAFIGYVFVTQLRKGNDMGSWINSIVDLFNGKKLKLKSTKSNLKVVYKNPSTPTTKSAPKKNIQEEVDRILEKIKKKGYEQLTAEEKDVLYRASKN